MGFGCACFHENAFASRRGIPARQVTGMQPLRQDVMLPPTHARLSALVATKDTGKRVILHAPRSSFLRRFQQRRWQLPVLQCALRARSRGDGPLRLETAGKQDFSQLMMRKLIAGRSVEPSCPGCPSDHEQKRVVTTEIGLQIHSSDLWKNGWDYSVRGP